MHAGMWVAEGRDRCGGLWSSPKCSNVAPMITFTITAHDREQIIEIERFINGVIERCGSDACVKRNTVSRNIMMALGVWEQDFPAISVNGQVMWKKTVPAAAEIEECLGWPRSVAEAVASIREEVEADRLRALLADPVNRYGLGQGIRNGYGLWRGNVDLLKSCGSEDMTPDDAAEVIMRAVERSLDSSA